MRVALLKQLYEANPRCCPRCGAELKIIAFIERHQTDVIEKILRHCGLCLPAEASAQAGEEPPARGPPVRNELVTTV